MLKQFSPNAGIQNPAGDFLYGLIIQRQIKQTQITLGAVATKLPSIPIQYRKSIQLFNNSADIIYLGNALVTTADGYPMYPRSQMTIQIEDGIDVFAISGGVASDIRICEGA